MAPTPLDSSFILQVQIAFLGVILVVGLFYIWRTVSRIEDKVDHAGAAGVYSGAGAGTGAGTCRQVEKGSCPLFPGQCEMMTPDFRNEPMNIAEANDAADALMKSVFGDVFVLSTAKPSVATNGVKVTEIVEEHEHEEQEIDADDADDADSVHSDTTSAANAKGGMSKTKLRKMGVNLLKELCSQRGLSVDGSKSALVDRLIEAA